MIFRFDPEGLIGKADIANIADVELEAAVTAIVDFEDSVATVDAVRLPVPACLFPLSGRNGN